MGHNKIPYKISYRKIKYPRLEFTTGELLLILPAGHNHNTFLEKHKNWIKRKMDFIKDCLKDTKKKKPVYRTVENFKQLVRFLAETTSMELNVKMGEIYFRTMKTKWASLSPKGNLIINMRMKDLPDHLIEYIVLHETAHLIEKRHNERFWRIISKKLSEYQEIEREMFLYWLVVNGNMANGGLLLKK